MECRPCPLPRGSAWVPNGRTLKAPVKSRYLMGWRLPAHRAFRRRFAPSHSGSQFLPHLPSHWYSDILPPHCGQTRLRIDERMRTFNSPGGASMVIMFEVSPRSGEGQKRGQNDGGMPRGFCALCDAPNWLAAESVHASRAAPRSAWGKQFRCHRQSPTKAANEAGASKLGFYRADTWASNGHACPNSGAVWRTRNSEGAAARPDKVTRQDGALPMRQKGKQKWGILPPRSAKSTTQQSGE
jgi:hypothetical protein